MKSAALIRNRADLQELLLKISTTAERGKVKKYLNFLLLYGMIIHNLADKGKCAGRLKFLNEDFIFHEMSKRLVEFRRDEKRRGERRI